MTVVPRIYSPCNRKAWDFFVENSKNGHFMFYRDYMDYHSDRFEDHSIEFYDEKGRLVALLPANINGTTLYSHQGLTFGGLVLSKNATVANVYKTFLALINFLKSEKKIMNLIYKRIPDFYHRYPSQEDLYSLFLLEAKLIRRDVSVAVHLQNPIAYQEMRRRNIKKGLSLGIEVEQIDSISEYWKLLEEVLRVQHNVSPVHSYSEIEILRSRFPKNIKCYVAKLKDELLAGTVVYETNEVAHTQYLANSQKGKELGALDCVIDYLLSNIYMNKRYFDFGISTENDGRILNHGLISQKEGFGARAVIHDFYDVRIG